MVYKILSVKRILFIINKNTNQMTESEKQSLYEAIRRNAPNCYYKIVRKLEQKRTMILSCIEIASQSNNSGYQEEINRIYNTCCSLMNKTETLMLNFICLIKHKEQINNGIQKEDTDIQRWVKILRDLRESTGNSDNNDLIIGVLDKQVRIIINQYKIRKGIGRPKGKGKKVFSYNGKEYNTIQECADDYNISKQGMYKKLKKFQII